MGFYFSFSFTIKGDGARRHFFLLFPVYLLTATQPLSAGLISLSDFAGESLVTGLGTKMGAVLKGGMDGDECGWSRHFLLPAESGKATPDKVGCKSETVVSLQEGRGGEGASLFRYEIPSPFPTHLLSLFPLPLPPRPLPRLSFSPFPRKVSKSSLSSFPTALCAAFPRRGYKRPSLTPELSTCVYNRYRPPPLPGKKDKKNTPPLHPTPPILRIGEEGKPPAAAAAAAAASETAAACGLGREEGVLSVRLFLHPPLMMMTVSLCTRLMAVERDDARIFFSFSTFRSLPPFFIGSCQTSLRQTGGHPSLLLLLLLRPTDRRGATDGSDFRCGLLLCLF